MGSGGPDAFVERESHGPVPCPLAIDAYVEDQADGPSLCATIRYVPDILDDEAVGEFTALWQRAVRALAEHVASPAVAG
ncbi:hypothetical protein P9209_16670 [Prescottella defluvii]|nr:hypothetical protein P9209_16670 [Prescottella defluvii]